MKREYTVRVTTSETYAYHIEAGSPEEAKELVLSGDYDPFETVDCSVDNVEVDRERMKYTVFYDQERTNFQVEAKTEEEAEAKADKLYRKRLDVPSAFVQSGWLVESDGEDK